MNLNFILHSNLINLIYHRTFSKLKTHTQKKQSFLAKLRLASLTENFHNTKLSIHTLAQKPDESIKFVQLEPPPKKEKNDRRRQVLLNSYFGGPDHKNSNACNLPHAHEANAHPKTGVYADYNRDIAPRRR